LISDATLFKVANSADQQGGAYIHNFRALNQ
jgi:hypothetical protein